MGPAAGVAYSGKYLEVGEAAREAMSGTARYVLLAVPAGAIGGFVVALLTGRSPMLTWLVAVVASVLAGAVAGQVGYLLGPPDPAQVAQHAADGTPVAAALLLPGVTPYFAFPVGALGGLALGFLLSLPWQAVRTDRDHAGSVSS